MCYLKILSTCILRYVLISRYNGHLRIVTHARIMVGRRKLAWLGGRAACAQPSRRTDRRRDFGPLRTQEELVSRSFESLFAREARAVILSCAAWVCGSNGLLEGVWASQWQPQLADIVSRNVAAPLECSAVSAACCCLLVAAAAA